MSDRIESRANLHLAAASSPSVADILRQVQRIQITARRSVNELFAGQYKSVFRGRGIEFDEVRPYQPGDDIRSIDWNVTARTGECFIKRFSEERELTVLFAVDVSASGTFGTGSQAKLDAAVRIAALLMFSASQNNDKVGLFTFCNDVEAFFPPRKGRSQVLRLIRQLVDVRPVSQSTSLKRPLEFLNRVQKRRAVVFLISDFLDELPPSILGVTRRRHDLIAIRVSDRREWELPGIGFMRFHDAETGEVVEIDTGNAAVRERFARQMRLRQAAVTDQLRKLGIDELSVDCQSDPAASLRRFFAAREHRVATFSSR